MTTNWAKGISPDFSLSNAPTYRKAFTTYFVCTLARTQNLTSYLSGLFGIKVTKEHLDFSSIGHFSVFTEKLQTTFLAQRYNNFKHFLFGNKSVSIGSCSYSARFVIKLKNCRGIGTIAVNIFAIEKLASGIFALETST